MNVALARTPRLRFDTIPSTFAPYALLALYASVLRLVLDHLRPGAAYFPDSWDYVVVPQEGYAPNAMHSPVVGWIWRMGTFNHLSEAHVLVLQGVFGVACTLLLYRLINRVLEPLPATLIAAAFCSIPSVLLVERTMLTESTAMLALLLALVATERSVTCRTKRAATVWLLTGAFFFGVQASIRPAFQIFAGLATIAVIATFILRRSDGRVLHRLSKGLPIAIGAGALAALPLLPLVTAYNDVYGTFTTSPAQGAVMASRFGPLLSCAAPRSDTALAKEAIAEACHETFTDPPGITTRIIWDPGAMSTALTTQADFKTTTGELSNAATAAIEHHPGAAIAQVLHGISWQLFHSPYNSLNQYWSGRGWSKGAAAAAFPNATAWFGVHEAPYSSAIPFGGAVASTLRIPQLVLYLAAILGLMNLVKNLARRKFRPTFAQPSLWLVGSLCVVLIAANVFSVAVGALPGFRYWTVLLPAIIFLVALGLPAALKRPIGQSRGRAATR